MLTQSIPDSKLAASAELARLIKRSRIKVIKVPGFTPVPRPARFHPEPKAKVVVPLTANMRKRQEQMHELKQLAAKGYTLRYASMCLGIGKLAAEKLAMELMDEGVYFPEPPRRDE